MSSAVARFVPKAILKPTIAKRAIKAVRPALKKVMGKRAAKRATKSLFSKIPLLSVGFGVVSGIQRIVCETHDPHRFWKAGAEVISGFAGCIPGVGTGVSCAVDAGILYADLAQEKGKMEIETPRVNAQNYNVTGNHNSTMTFGNGNQVGPRSTNLAINYQ